jgi:Arc/MetJ-type ribon-helix-helix transcriptional regulator
MGKAKIAITVDEHALAEIDRLVERGVSPNRSKAIEDAVQELIAKLHRSRLAQECAKLDVREEQALAEEGYAGSLNEIIAG